MTSNTTQGGRRSSCVAVPPSPRSAGCPRSRAPVAAAHPRVLGRGQRRRTGARARAEGDAVGEGRRGRLRRHDRRAAPHRLALRDQARRLRQRSVQADRHRVDQVRVQRAAAVAQAAPHRHRRARPGAAARSRKKRSAAINGPTNRASCRPTTPTRRRATSPARSSTSTSASRPTTRRSTSWASA